MGASVEAALGKAAAKVAFKWRDKTYTINPLSWDTVFSPLTRWMIDREAQSQNLNWRRLVDVGLLSPETAVAKSESFIDDAVNKGKYAYGSTRMMRVLQPLVGTEASQDDDAATLEARFKMFSLMCGVPMDTMIEMMGEIGDEIMLKLRMITAEGMPAPKESSPA